MRAGYTLTWLHTCVLSGAVFYMLHQSTYWLVRMNKSDTCSPQRKSCHSGWSSGLLKETQKRQSPTASRRMSAARSKQHMHGGMGHTVFLIACAVLFLSSMLLPSAEYLEKSSIASSSSMKPDLRHAKTIMFILMLRHGPLNVCAQSSTAVNLPVRICFGKLFFEDL
jgi:hypothetical protein